MSVNSTSRNGGQGANEPAEDAAASSKPVAAVNETAAASETLSETDSGQRLYSVIERMVAEVSQDHAHLRTFIYEYARIQLRKELYPRFLEGAWSEIEEQMQALEEAIDRLETEYEQATPLPIHAEPRLIGADKSLRADNVATESPSPAAHFGTGGTRQFGAGGTQARSVLNRSRADDRSSRAIAFNGPGVVGSAFVRHLHSRLWLTGYFLIAAVIGLAIYAAFDATALLDKAGLHWLDRPSQVVAKTDAIPRTAPTAAQKQQQIAHNESRPPRVADVPVPTDYGAYAVVNGRLIELEQLGLKVPDPRVAISAAIATPSQTHLPASPRQFVIFRKDLLNNTPERAAVRVVAQVVRALTFEGNGAPKSKHIEQSWVIRNTSYPMRLGPLADNPEMVVIRSEQTDFLLPAGRYVLVLKGIGYDFTIDGPVTDHAHCLERTDALNAPIYSECPKS